MFGMMPDRSLGSGATFSEDTKLSWSKDESNKDDAFIKSLQEAIENVRNVKQPPPALYYNIDSFTHSVDAVDINDSNSILAFSFHKSPDIYLKLETEKVHPPVQDEAMILQYSTLRFAKHLSEESFRSPSEKYLQGHTRPVTGLKFVSDMDLLFSCAQDGFVKAWDLEDFTETATYSASKDLLYDIDASPVSQQLVTVGVNGVIKLFAFDNLSPLHDFSEDSDDDVNVVRFHPNGLYFATAADNKISLWNIKSGSISRTLVDDDYVRSLAFSPDGKCLASYSGGCIKIWDLATARQLIRIENSEDKESTCRLCFCGSQGILTCGSGSDLKLWNVDRYLEEQNESSDDSNISLLQNETFPGEIKFIKYDHRNHLTYVIQNITGQQEQNSDTKDIPNEQQNTDSSPEQQLQQQNIFKRPLKGLLLSRAKRLQTKKTKTKT